MADCSAAIDFVYGECCIGFSTRVLWSEKERSVGMLTFIFWTGGVTSKWRGAGVLWTSSFGAGIPMRIHVSSCTTVAILP